MNKDHRTEMVDRESLPPDVLERLERYLLQIAEAAKDIFSLPEYDGTALFTCVNPQELRLRAWIMPISSDGLQVLLPMFAAAAQHHHAQMISVCSIAWASQDVNSKPSEAADRRELLLIQVGERAQPGITVLLDVKRDAEGKIQPFPTAMSPNYGGLGPVDRIFDIKPMPPALIDMTMLALSPYELGVTPNQASDAKPRN